MLLRIVLLQPIVLSLDNYILLEFGYELTLFFLMPAIYNLVKQTGIFHNIP